MGLIIAAAIAAIPATIAAINSKRSLVINRKQLTPSNGHSVVEMIEELWDALARADEDRDSMHDQLDDHDDRLRDVQAHMYHQGVCENCGAITEK